MKQLLLSATTALHMAAFLALVSLVAILPIGARAQAVSTGLSKVHGKTNDAKKKEILPVADGPFDEDAVDEGAADDFDRGSESGGDSSFDDEWQGDEPGARPVEIKEMLNPYIASRVKINL